MRSAKRWLMHLQNCMEMENIVVPDVGRYGFVKMQYYKPPWGFDDAIFY